MTATISIDVPAVGAAVAFGGVLLTLWINGVRSERQRRRDLHARALKAVIDYGEMPFMIRRRRLEDEHRSAERVRLSDHFSEVKAEIAACQLLLGADGDEKLTRAYDRLFQKARTTVGEEAHAAWKGDPVRVDADMNMGPLFTRLEPFRAELRRFERELAHATLPRRHRAVRWLRGTDVS